MALNNWTTPPMEALSHVFLYFDANELRKLREVCKSWKDAINKMEACMKTKRNERVFFTNSNSRSIEMFKNLSLPWRHFQFTCIDLEKELLQHPDIFRWFALNYCVELKSLTFDECILPTGRFFELMAFCKKIDKLTIKNSPSIFKPNFGIFHWKFCFNHVKANFARITRLVMVDEMVPEEDLMGLAKDMTNLQVLHVGVSPVNKLPIHAIGKILRNNCNSLRKLKLSGVACETTCPDAGLFPDTLPEMKCLDFLNIQRFTISGTKMATFLSKCPALTSLNFTFSQFQTIDLSNALTRVKALWLMQNAFSSSLFDTTTEFAGLTELHVVHFQMSIGTKAAVRKLLGGIPKPQLNNLELQLMEDGGSFLKTICPAHYPKLTKLVLSKCVDIAGPGLRSIFRNHPGLTSLAITECREIMDESLCPASDPTDSLGNLRQLTFLDLSDTKIGDRTIKNCVTGNMPELKTLVLYKTEVTSSSVCELLEAVEKDSLPLTLVNAKRSKCKFSQQQFASHFRALPHVEVQCEINMS